MRVRVPLVALCSLALVGLGPLPARADAIVNVPDAAFRACLIRELGAGEVPLTDSRLASLDEVACWNNSGEEPIRDLTGAEHLTGARTVSFSMEEITDLSPLAGLADLQVLLISGGPTVDPAPLRGLSGLTELSLSGHLLDDLGFLTDLPSLRKLHLGGMSVDLGPVARLTALTELSLGTTGTTDFSWMSDLTSLTKLALYDDTLTELHLGHAPNLDTLYLGGKNLTDLSTLSDLNGLTHLWLITPAATDLDPLSALSRMAELEIYNTTADLTPLCGLTGLATLVIRDSRLSGLPDLSGMTSLSSITVVHDQLTSLIIGTPPSLTTLDASNNHLTDVALSGLPALQTLNLSSNKLTNLRLTDLPALATVDARTNTLTNPGTYERLPRLSSLNLNDNQLTTLDGVSGLPTLTEVDLINNELASTDGLADLPALATLRATNNQLTDLTALAGLPSLAAVWLTNNRISDLGPLTGAPLTELHASSNQVHALPAFTALQDLDQLELASNGLSDIHGLTGATALRTADLRNNALTDVSVLAQSPHLTSMTLSNNKISDVSAFDTATTTVTANGQQVTATEVATVATPTDLTIRGFGGDLPALSLDANTTYADGQVAYATSGTHTVGFTQANGSSAFSGTLIQRAGPDAAFTTIPPPRLSGRAVVSYTTAVYAKPWTPAVDHYEYQWYVNGKVVPGANDWGYIPVAKDLGKRIRAQVTGVKDGYISITRWTPWSDRVIRGWFWTHRPKIVGTTQTGQQLSIQMDPWQITPERFTYRWLRNGNPITGATKPTYTPTARDRGKHLSVRVTGHAAGIHTESETSRRTVAITQGAVHSSQPTITGTPDVGQTLGVDRGAWGPGTITFRHQWLRDGIAIAGATRSTYQLTDTDRTHQISLTVTGDRANHTAVTRTADPLTVP
ncbi:MAG: leucine-rich repeat domain-containing protein [Propionicimonas sp.]|uniref:leucine-rich repeat domain-containing protein n=1 Tax=Propionicimonas sp. TaxID=1955623 RepID=UPI003D098BA6